MREKIKKKKEKYKDYAYNPKMYKEARRLRRITNKLHKKKKEKYKDYAYNPKMYKEARRSRRITNKLHKKRKELLQK